MFGFGNNRKKYNGAVDLKLNNEYQIQTKNNDKFPGMLAYLELIDNARKAKMNEDEAAMYIATLYYCGIAKNGYLEEAEVLLERIQSIAMFCLPKNMISEDHWRRFLGAIEEANSAAGIEV